MGRERCAVNNKHFIVRPSITIVIDKIKKFSGGEVELNSGHCFFTTAYGTILDVNFGAVKSRLTGCFHKFDASRFENPLKNFFRELPILRLVNVLILVDRVPL